MMPKVNDPVAEKKLSRKELGKYTALIKNGDNFEKEKAIDALVAFGGREVVESIIPILQEKNTPARMAVLDVLKKIGSDHIDGIIGMLSDENEDIRVYACEVLSFLSDKRSVPHIVKKVYEDTDNVRNAACMALGEFDDDEAVNALLDALKDEEWIAFSAILSLGRTKSPKAVPKLIEFFRTSGEELSSAACEVLIEYGDNAVLDEVFDVLKGWDRQKRSIYLKIILEIGSEEIFGRLMEKIGDELYEHLLYTVGKSRQQSLDAIRMLTNFRTRETCDSILAVLKGMEPDDERYEEVLELFASLSDVWSKNIAEYMSLDETVLFPFIRACTMTGVRIKETMLLDRFLSASVDVKREIIMNAPSIVDGTGAIIIKEAIRDTDGHIKGFAVEAAGNLGLKDLREDIMDILKKDFHDVRVKALKTLIRLDPGTAMVLVEKFVDKGTADDKKVYLASTGLMEGGKNLPFIVKLLKDEDEGVRRSTIGIIGNFMDDERYVELLQKILMDDDIPHEVLKVVKDKRLSRFKDRLVSIFENQAREMWTRYYALSALGSFEDPGLFDIFQKGLDDENGLIVIGCIRALADLNDTRAMQFIRPFMDNSNDDIRSAAEMVISKMESI